MVYKKGASRDTFGLRRITGQENRMPLVIGYGTKGAAWMLGVSVSTIKRMVYRGELKPINLEGTPYLFKCSDIERLRNRE